MTETNSPSQKPSFTELCLSINGKPLFSKLSLEFKLNQWTCLLGPSGIGKSMLLRTALGFNSTEVSKGIVTEGDILGFPQREVAYMAQQDLLMPWLSVLDNVTLGSRLRNEKPNTQRAIEYLEAVGLRDQIKHKPATLSGGMRQRVALARTLMEDKSIVLMDEPFSALDAITKIKLQELASKLLKGKTVIMVTHDPLEALRLSHDIYILKGSPATYYKAEVPLSDVPRAVNDPDILALQGSLLALLSGKVQ